MQIIEATEIIFNQIDDLLGQLAPDEYVQPLALMSEASIGQHIRHILEFYGCFFDGLHKERISYEKRKRRMDIEQDRSVAKQILINFRVCLPTLSLNHPIVVEACFSADESDPSPMASSVLRELFFNLEHAIHHLAIIKMAVVQYFPSLVLDNEFGVAPSTLAYRQLMSSN